MKANAFAATLVAGPLLLALLTACGERSSEPTETKNSQSAEASSITESTATAAAPTTTAPAPAGPATAGPAITAPLASSTAAAAPAEAVGGTLGDKISDFMWTEKSVQIAPADAATFAEITCEGLSQGKGGTDILNAAERSFPGWNRGDLESLMDASVGFGCPQYESAL